MTKLVVDELVTELDQTFTLTLSRVYHIKALKIKLLMYNEPSGTFTLSIKQGATVLNSASFTSSDIKTELATSDSYAWLYKGIEFPTETLLNKGDYTLNLAHSGYTYSKTSFIGWVKSYENIFNEKSETYIDDFTNPLDFLLYDRVRGDLIK